MKLEKKYYYKHEFLNHVILQANDALLIYLKTKVITLIQKVFLYHL